MLFSALKLFLCSSLNIAKLWWAKAWVRPSVHIYVISLKPWQHILCNTKIISCNSLSLAPFILIWGDRFPGSLQTAFIHQQQCRLRPYSLYASWFDFHALHSGLKHPYEPQQILWHVNSTDQLMHCHFQGQKNIKSSQTDRKQAQNNPSHIINQAIQAIVLQQRNDIFSASKYISAYIQRLTLRSHWLPQSWASPVSLVTLPVHPDQKEGETESSEAQKKSPCFVVHLTICCFSSPQNPWYLGCTTTEDLLSLTNKHIFYWTRINKQQLSHCKVNYMSPRLTDVSAYIIFLVSQ